MHPTAVVVSETRIASVRCRAEVAVRSVSQMALPEVQAEERIDAPAEALYELISDITRTGEWSPENVGGRWLGTATGPAVGARFRGSNRRGFRRWSTTCTVVAADPGRRFAFDVAFAGIPVARWSYGFAPDGDGTVVTETWTDRRPGLFAAAARPIMGIPDMRAHNERNMRATLANLREVATR
jgi:hypothetical protein